MSAVLISKSVFLARVTLKRGGEEWVPWKMGFFVSVCVGGRRRGYVI